MGVVEAPTEEEAYLYCILTDPSGLDLAEFTWQDHTRDDNCFRAHPYQWKWWRSEDPLQIDQCARSVGKSLSIKLRAFSFPFRWPGQEMVITGPEGVHVDAITDLIETQVLSTRLSKEMLSGGRGSGIKHKPFHMNFANGARIMGRIPQRDGKGVKGIHPIELELDEAQDYPERGWTELIETLKRGSVGAKWRAHGVTRGVRDKFFELTQETSEWKVHRITSMHRPDWTDEERQQKIKEYGSRDDPDYRRNVLGAHGDAANPLFVLHRLMRCVDTDESGQYNDQLYYNFTIKDTELDYLGAEIEQVIDFPAVHKQMYSNFWAGMDVGYTHDPSVILVFAEYHPKADEIRADKAAGRAVPLDGQSRLRLITKLSLLRLPNPLQIRAIMHTIDFYRPRAFSMDKTGVGLVLYQDLQERVKKECEDQPISVMRERLERMKGYGFSEKVLVGIDEAIEVSDTMENEEVAKEAGLTRNVLEYSTDKLREYVDTGRLMLPWDRDLIGEFQGQTFTYSKAAMDMYGRARRIFSQGSFHALDAARMAAMGHAQFAIEEFMKTTKERPPVLDSFIQY